MSALTDDLVIQIESKQDMEYIVSNIRTAANEKLQQRIKQSPVFNRTSPSNANTNASLEEQNKDPNGRLASHLEIEKKAKTRMDAIIDKVFHLVSTNVQINGMDWNSAMAPRQLYESFDESLLKRWNECQENIEPLLLELADKRSRIMSRIGDSFRNGKKRVRESVDASVQLKRGHLEEKENLAVEEVENGIGIARSVIVPDMCLENIEATVNTLATLESSIPSIMSKLERARIVLLEEGQRVLSGADNEETEAESPLSPVNRRSSINKASSSVETEETVLMKKLALTKELVSRTSRQAR